MTQHLWSRLDASLSQHTTKPAWICRQKKGRFVLSYQDLRAAVISTAAALRRQGIKPGDTVGITAPNGPHWSVAALASWRVGACIAPIHINNSDHEIEQQIAAIQPDIMLVHESKIDYPKMIDISLEADFDVNKAELDIVTEIDPHSVAARIYTSGSTGTPKVVRLSHSNFMSNILAAKKLGNFTSEDRFLALLPLSHAMGILANIFVPLDNGATIVTPKVLAASEILEALEQEGITVLVAVPRLFRNVMNGLEKKFASASGALKAYISLMRRSPLRLNKILNAPIRKKLGGNITVWVSGGSHLDGSITKYYHQLGIPLRQGYGLTETSPLSNVQADFDPASESVGRPIDGVEIHINDPDESGAGEVWIKGPNVMLGYEDETQNADAMEDNWFKTGDIGKLDEIGNLTLTGRSKRLIVTDAGKNVYPEELETLLERDPVVKEAGVLEKDMKPVCIFSFESDTPIAEARRVLKGFNKLVSSHNQITRFALTDEIPRTPLGKMALQELPDLFDRNEVPAGKTD